MLFQLKMVSSSWGRAGSFRQNKYYYFDLSSLKVIISDLSPKTRIKKRFIFLR